VVLAEVWLGIKENSAKKFILDYADTKRPQGLRWGGFLKENLDTYVTDGLGGQVRWTTNAEGFRSDRDFSREPGPGVLRILSLGDSFNAGFRVGQDETLAHLQNDWINQHYGRAEILVAETEEPGTALYYLDRFGLQLKPHIVLLGITLGNDIAQAYQVLDVQGQYTLTREPGGVQIKVNETPTIGFNQLATFEIPPDYLKSESPAERFFRRCDRWVRRRHLLRRFLQQHEAITSWGDRDHLSLFDPNNGFGMFTDPRPEKIEAAYQRLFRILEGFALTCRGRGIIFAVQLFPQRYQVQPEDWARAVKEYGLKASRYNLLAPNHIIGAFCRDHGIICIDPTAAMASWYSNNQKPLYLPRGDMHWNKLGHQVFFDCSLQEFEKLVQVGFQKVKTHNSEDLPGDQIRSTPSISKPGA
jgi:hypothetical protein